MRAYLHGTADYVTKNRNLVAGVMRQRAHPGTDLGAYAGELVRLFDLGIRR